MEKKLVALLVALALLQVVYSQVYITVYEGKVQFTKQARILKPNYSYTIPENELLEFANGSVSVVFTKSQFFYVTPGKEPHNFEYNDVKPKISYAEIKQKLQKIGKGASGILDYLQKLHTASALESTTVGSIVGGVRGITGKSPRSAGNTSVTWPEDSITLLSNTVTLQWPKENQPYGTEILLINLQSNDTIYKKLAAADGKATVTIDKEGIYTWLLYSKLLNKKSVKRTIIKPGDKQIKKMQETLALFKSQLVVFDEETAALILEDYLYKNNIAQN